MSTKNDITGDNLVSKNTTEAYRDGWERIFGKNKTSEEKQGSNKEENINSKIEKDQVVENIIETKVKKPKLK